MTQYPIFSADDFRARAQDQMGLPLEEAWNAHGDHALNPVFVGRAQELKLRDAAVLIPVVDDGEKASVILTQRTTTLREAEEEIGLSRMFVEPVGRLPTYFTPTGFRITPVLSVVKRGFTLELNPAEVDDVFEVPLPFLMDEANHQRGSRVLDGVERHFFLMPYGERNIWGITAGILRTLYERLYA